MPLLVYKCECGIEFEALILCTADLVKVGCPKCHSQNIEWVPATFSVQFKSNPLGSYRGPASNPFENLTLQHVHGDDGQPVKVNSLSELREAQKKYNFSHAVADSLTQEAVDTPPQHEPWAGDIRKDYEWKWTPPEQRDDISGVNVGPTTRDQLLVEEGVS